MISGEGVLLGTFSTSFRDFGQNELSVSFQTHHSHHLGFQIYWHRFVHNTPVVYQSYFISTITSRVLLLVLNFPTFVFHVNQLIQWFDSLAAFCFK